MLFFILQGIIAYLPLLNLLHRLTSLLLSKVKLLKVSLSSSNLVSYLSLLIVNERLNEPELYR